VARPRAPRQRWWSALVAPVPPIACWVALAFWWASVFPTLMPRTWWSQGIISGTSVVVGIALGTLVSWAVRAVVRLTGREVPRVMPYARRTFAGIAAVVVAAGGGACVTWQNGQRELLGLDPIRARWVLPMLATAIAAAALLFLMGRTIAWAVRRLDRRITRSVPRPMALAATALVVVVVSVVVTRDVVADRVLDAVNESFGRFDETTPAGITRPTSSARSGGPGSLVPWDTLGYEGRNFTGGGPTVDQLQAFADAGSSGSATTAMEPIRVYAGLESADGPEAQAALVVDELERTGAFERSVLAVVTVTGTGWVDPVSAAALEHLHAGDTAIAATQYSYLPSWISFLVDADKAAENGRALIGAVSERWSQLPADERPRLVVFGLSLGSYGAEEALAGDDLAASLANATSEADAVLLAGATFANPMWRQVVEERTPSSPVFAPGTAGVTLLGSPSAPPIGGRLPGRPVVYVTHPTDPVTWVSADSLYRRPAWMGPPRGVGVPDPLLWAPGVTLLQEGFDLMAGFSAPPGYGHDYNPNMADAWAAVAAPDDWTAKDTQRLRDTLLSLSTTPGA
jgi:uncharacterized membrane protein